MQFFSNIKFLCLRETARHTDFFLKMLVIPLTSVETGRHTLTRIDVR